MSLIFHQSIYYGLVKAPPCYYLTFLYVERKEENDSMQTNSNPILSKFKEKYKASPFSDTKALVILALLLSLEIILSRFFSIQALTYKFGFSFIPIVIAALLYGPSGSISVALLGDILGATLFPAGPFFIGFTITALLKGTLYGVVLKRKQTLPYIVGMVTASQILGSLLLNTLWLNILYGEAFFAMLPGRVLQTIVLGAFEIILIPIVNKTFMPQLRRLASR